MTIMSKRGSGITVIECEVFEENGHTYLRNAGQLVAALDDMTENPAHGFNYGVCLHIEAVYLLGFACIVGHGVKPNYGFVTINTFNVAYRDDSISGNEVDTRYWVTNDYSFRATDIDENGTATLRVDR
jgi:hypothetical protein